MTTYLSCVQQVHESEIAAEHLEPQFRKATANMLAAYFACKKSLDMFGEIEKKSLAVIVSSFFGEVSSTLEFLTTLKESNLAKPILFQNSLHNSTLGFIAIQLGLTGPALTLSSDKLTNSAIAATAHGLLQLNEHVLVCTVDVVPSYLKKYYVETFPALEHNLGYAKAFVLSKTKLPGSKSISLSEFKVENVSLD